jgi:PPOX class F420-dependent enzyme/OxyR family protein
LKFSNEEERFLKENEIGRLATVSSNELPHVVPVCFIYDSGYFWVSTDSKTKKFRNILANNKVALVVDSGYDLNRGILVQGTAQVYEKGREFRRLYSVFYKKFAWVRADPWKEGEGPLLRIQPDRKVCWGLH